MALKRPAVNSMNTVCHQCRSLHRLVAQPRPLPRPTPFVPDVNTFLTLIGRGMSKHAAKIPSWEALFRMTSQQLKDSGIEPPRARKYLLWWRQRFWNGLHGIGGDAKNVTDGVVRLRIAEVPSERPMDQNATLTRGSGRKKVIHNDDLAASAPTDAANTQTKTVDILGSLAPPMRLDSFKEVKHVAGLKIVHANRIAGTGVEAVRGQQGVALLKVKDGLWEQRRGHKVDGGERRKAEVRAKRRAAERKNAR